MAAPPSVARTVIHPPGPPLRPVVDGTVEIHDSDDGHFRIWYALDGGDALTGLAEDEDPADGVPDAVNRVAEGLARMWEVQVDEEGWRAPGNDMGVGGDSRLDVYLRHLDYNGYAHAEWHDDHWAAYLEVDPAVATLGGEVLASVAGHELHHAIEYSYSVEPPTWVHESSATYAQYRLFHETAAMVAAIQLLWGLRLDAPEAGLAVTGDRMEYAAFVWVKFLVDDSGSQDTARRWWEILADEPDWRWSIEALAAELGEGDALALFEEFSEWLYFSCEADDGQHWVDDGMGCQLEIGARVAADHDGLPATIPLEGPGHFGAVYATVSLAGGEPLAVACTGPEEEGWSVRAVALEGGVARARRSARSGPEGVAALELPEGADADQLLLMVANGTAAPGAPYACEVEALAEAPPTVDDGCSCGTEGRRGAGLTGAAVLVLLAARGWVTGRRRR